MTGLFREAWQQVKRLDRDEGGADMVEYILLVAVIALPLLAVIIIYRNKIGDLLSDMFSDVEENATMDIDDY